MEQLHEPLLKQCIASLTLNNNVLKQCSPDNFCVLKNDGNTNQQAAKTVSVVLTRLTNAATSYVHVLRCNVCDYLTLNPSTLKEHFHLQHPSSLGFLTYTCSQCSSLSTERCLMEEHLRIYHRITENPTAKLIERFHTSVPTTDVFSVNCVSPPTVSGSGLPFSVMNSNTTFAQNSLALNLANAITALQNANKAQSQQTIVSAESSSCTTYTISTVSSAKTPVTTTFVSPENSEQDANADSQIFQDGSISSEAQISTLSNPAFAISGSRRRKATTPGRICLSASKSTKECLPVEEMDTGTCGPNQSLVNSIKIENPLLGSSPAIKRTFSSGVDEVDGQIKDIKSPKSKRICKDMDSKVADINTSKSLFVSNVTPLCLSIGNSVADTKQVPVVTFSSPHLNGLNSMTVASPFLGQLIPLSSLPENLICGLSATLMHNLQTSTMSNITDTLPVTSTENHHEMSTANNPPSAWVLTNPSTNLSANLSQQTALNALQPTLFVPVPTLGDSSISSSIKVPQSGDTSAASNPSANGAGILRYPDIIEALKCMAANGNLISSINVPASSYSTNLPTTGNNSINVADNIGRLQSVSHISPSNLSSSESLAALVAHLTASNHSQAGPQPMGIHMPITINSSVTPTDNNVIDPLSFCATSTSEMSNIPSFTTLVSHAPVYSKVDRAGSDRTNLIPVNSIEANEDISFASNDQALDMSVRSITMPSEHSNSLLGMSSLIKSDDKSINLFTGIDVNDSSYKETNTLEQPTFSVVNNVADVINAALKGGLKQRLIQSIEVPVSSLFPNPAHCLTALTNTISSLPSVNETVINSDHSADKLNQNVNCQTECHNNATNIKKPMTNSSMVSSVRNSEPLTFTGVDNKSVQTTISTGALANSPSTSSHVVSLTQLQAIMAALVNASSVSISVPANSTVSGSSLSVTPTCTNALSSLNTPNLSFQQIINHTTPTVSSSNTGVLINTPIPTSNLTMSGSVTASEAGSTSLVPGLNNLTSVCGFTLSGASGLVNNSTTYSPSASKNLGTINSSIKGITVPPGECISLTGVLSGNVASLHGNSGHLGHTVVGNPALINFISGNKSPMQSSVTLTSANAARLLNSLTTSTGTNVLPMANNGSISTNVSVCGGTLLGAASLPSGAISLLDPQQALFAAAAAAAAQNIQRPGAIQNAVNQIALANLKTSNAGGRHIGTSTPVIGLLDPRAALQLRVADASSTVSTILTSASLSNCFNNATYSHTLENDQTETQVNDSTRGITSETDLNHTSELETGSNYEDQMDEEWEAEQDETCSVHSGPQHLCSKQNDRICDKTSGDSESPSKSDQKGETILKTDISCSLLPGSSNKRFSGSARTSGASSSGGRRGLSSFNDPNNQQQLRPHRQNFTPTQNRILTEWYQLHQAKPYPSTDDTKELANISGLSYSQVKKWFANKRARSTSSGLPKPTPPLAPDSSTDPSAAAAIVAAAVAAATSAVADSGNVITSTPTTTVNTPSNVATIAASISDSDAALSLQPFLLKPKPLSFTSQPYADLSIPKTENENETEFVSSLISSHLQINQECIKTVLLSTSNYNSTTSNDNLVETSKVDGEDEVMNIPLEDNSIASDDSQENNDNQMILINNSINPSDSVCYSASSPPTLHVHINHRLNSPTNRLDTLSSPSSSSSSSSASSSLSDAEYNKQQKTNKTPPEKQIKEGIEIKSVTCEHESVLIITEETNSNTSDCSSAPTITNLTIKDFSAIATDTNTTNDNNDRGIAQKINV